MSGSTPPPPDDGLTPPEFAALVEELGAGLLRFLRRMVGDTDLAEDLLQDTCVAAYQHRAAAHRGSIRAWFFTIAANRARNALRDGRRTVLSRPVPEEIPERTTPEGEVLRQELRARVLAAVGGLPPDSREAILLRDVEDLPYEEVAAIMGVARGTARVRVYRARELLRDALRAYLAGEPVGQEEPR